VVGAKIRDMTLKERLHKLVEKDHGASPNGGRPKRDISAIVGLFDSGGSNIARDKERYLDEAAWSEYQRKMGRTSE
jgi:hypothetical protein